MGSLIWKRRLGRWFGSVDGTAPRRVILLYHALGPQWPAVSAAAFRAQVEWLTGHACLRSLPDLLQAEPQPAAAHDKPLQVALSFDDGYASLHDAVAPILRDAGTAATVYLNTAHVGETVRQRSDPLQGHYPGQEFLLWPEVEALVEAGWQVGSHGVHHVDLARAGPHTAAAELLASRQAIELRLQQPCAHFAYTWGHYNRRLQTQVRAAGYASAASALHGPLRADSDRFALPRVDVRADYELQDFIAAVTGQWDWLRLKQQMAGHQ